MSLRPRSNGTPFGDWLIARMDLDKFADLERQFRGTRGAKYLDVMRRAQMSFGQLRRFGCAATKRPQRILDIGCGPSYLGVAALFYGHVTRGLDMPLREPHVYTALCAFFGMKKVIHKVTRDTVLPDVGVFDVITSTVTQFDCERAHPWSVQDWQAFIKDARSHLTPDGRLYVTLTHSEARPREVWDFFRATSRWHNQHQAFLL